MKAEPSGKATERSPLPDRDAVAGRVVLSGVAVGLDAAAIPFTRRLVRIGAPTATVVRAVAGGIAEPFTAGPVDERVRPS